MFNINTHIQSKNEGSAAERFLRRHPRSSLPNSVKREIEHRELIQARHKKQKRIAEQKGRVSADTFELNDRVILQDPETRRWILKGTITKKREADDKSTHSFEILLDSGGTTMRNKRFIRHEYAPSNKRVSFANNTSLDPANTEQPEATRNAESKEQRAPLTRRRSARKQVQYV